MSRRGFCSYCKKQMDVSFSCVCPVIDDEFRHNIVKVAVDPRGDSRAKFIILLTPYWVIEKTDAFYWLKSDRSTFQIFCSRLLRQYRINYKFNVSVRLLTIKISQWAGEDSAVIVKRPFYSCVLSCLALFFFKGFTNAQLVQFYGQRTWILKLSRWIE